MARARPSPDAQAEAILAQDLSEADLSQYKPMRFTIVKNDASMSIRMRGELLAAVRAKAALRGVSCGRYVRMLLEADIHSS